MTKRKILIPILSAVMAVFISLGVAFALGAFAPKPVIAATDWVANQYYTANWSGNPETGTATCNQAGSIKYDSQYISDRNFSTTNYTISCNVQTGGNASSWGLAAGIGTEFQEYGIYANYRDMDNFLLFFLRYEKYDDTVGRILGRLCYNDRSNGVDSWITVNETLSWTNSENFKTALKNEDGNDEWSINDRKYNSQKSTNLKVERRGANYDIYFNNYFIYTYISTTSNATAVPTKVGLYASNWNDVASFSNFVATEFGTITAGSYSYTVYQGLWSVSGSNLRSATDTILGFKNVAINTGVPVDDKKEYTINVTGQASGTQNINSSGVGACWGIVPYYVNRDNYLIVSLGWGTRNGSNVMRALTIMEVINGNVTYYDTYTNDTAGLMTGYVNVAYTTAVKLTVSRTNDGTTDSFVISYNDRFVKSYTPSSELATLGKDTAGYGFFATNCYTTFSNFSMENNTYPTFEYATKTYRGLNDLWTGGSSINVKDSALGFKNIAVTTDLSGWASEQQYNIKVTGKASSQTLNGEVGVCWGIVPYYVDRNNYIVMSLGWGTRNNNNVMRAFTVMEVVNGKVTYIDDFTVGGNGISQFVNNPYTTQVELSVTRTNDGSKDNYAVFYGGTLIKNFTPTANLNTYGKNTAGYGLFATGGNVAFTVLAKNELATVTYQKNGSQYETKTVAKTDVIPLPTISSLGLSSIDILENYVNGTKTTATTYTVTDNVTINSKITYRFTVTYQKNGEQYNSEIVNKDTVIPLPTVSSLGLSSIDILENYVNGTKTTATTYTVNSNVTINSKVTYMFTVTYQVNGVTKNTETLEIGSTVDTSAAMGKTLLGETDSFVAITVDGAVTGANTLTLSKSTTVNVLKLGMTMLAPTVEVGDNETKSGLTFNTQVNATDVSYLKTFFGIGDSAFEYHTVFSKDIYYGGNYTLSSLAGKQKADRTSELSGGTFGNTFVTYSYELATAFSVINYVKISVGGTTYTVEGNAHVKTSSYALISEDAAGLATTYSDLLASIVRLSSQSGTQTVNASTVRAVYINTTRIAYVDQNGSWHVDPSYSVSYNSSNGQLTWSQK